MPSPVALSHRRCEAREDSVMQLIEITSTRRELHTAFCDYAAQVFPRVDFRRWIGWGEWTPDYRAFALFDSRGRVLANASLMKMRLLLDGRPQVGWQFGAVGTLPAYRRKGLAKICMDAALGAIGRDPALLFANPTVLSFYPRFGFQRQAEHVFTAAERLTPSLVRAQPLDGADPAVRQELKRLLKEGVAVSNRFGARGYDSVLSWYLANPALHRQLWRLADDFYVFADVTGDTLCVDEVLAGGLQPLAPWLQQIITEPVAQIRFGFTPERWWPQAQASGVDRDSCLFVRQWPAGSTSSLPSRFPPLAQT